jgi:putative effector of murein hydrolase
VRVMIMLIADSIAKIIIRYNNFSILISTAPYYRTRKKKAEKVVEILLRPTLMATIMLVQLLKLIGPVAER